MVQKVKQPSNEVTDYIAHLLLTIVVFPNALKSRKPHAMQVDKVLVTVNLAASPEHDEPYDYDFSDILNEYLKVGNLRNVFDLENEEQMKLLRAVLPLEYRSATISIIDVEEVDCVTDRSMPYGIMSQPHADPQAGVASSDYDYDPEFPTPREIDLSDDNARAWFQSVCHPCETKLPSFTAGSEIVIRHIQGVTIQMSDDNAIILNALLFLHIADIGIDKNTTAVQILENLGYSTLCRMSKECGMHITYDTASATLIDVRPPASNAEIETTVEEYIKPGVVALYVGHPISETNIS
jgi:hypothetical protein